MFTCMIKQIIRSSLCSHRPGKQQRLFQGGGGARHIHVQVVFCISDRLISVCRVFGACFVCLPLMCCFLSTECVQATQTGPWRLWRAALGRAFGPRFGGALSLRREARGSYPRRTLCVCVCALKSHRCSITSACCLVSRCEPPRCSRTFGRGWIEIQCKSKQGKKKPATCYLEFAFKILCYICSSLFLGFH